jgi:hypothetical protein
MTGSVGVRHSALRESIAGFRPAQQVNELY